MSLQYASWEPPAPPLARKWLNEAASLTANPANTITADIGKQYHSLLIFNNKSRVQLRSMDLNNDQD
jgi:hypothetical protein